ncbi:YitT family protein [Aneurinibacillus sp. Ricciae_BoGa-3]|uniref:YitT family protein n=1 Tax=Aneurinibacillus sp. Ricciae_BoGa-3 TaxID=3022697 RepID=UPI0023423905|nr:YitT family protein [Aneurinibacillus sp. Ricciae_BoGa-3]WCK52763.1 YitT family protein [Aneurinibacillus sp. Ricciae_BoGa-3]
MAWKNVRPYLFITIGCFLYSIAVNAFFVNNRLAQGGVTGISLLLHYMFNTPVGLLIIVMNIPIFILGYLVLGRGFLILSAYGMLMTSILIDATSSWHVPPLHNVILAPIYGGIIAGAGIGLIFRVGGTTGGGDIIARVLQHKYRNIELGKFLFLIDFIIISLSSAIIGLEKAMLTIVAVFVSARVVDMLLSGQTKQRGAMIISSKSDDIAQSIQTRLIRGVTMLHSMGGYSKQEGNMLFVVVAVHELDKLRRIIKEVDERAFIVIFDAKEVLGEGFSIPSAVRKHLESQ